jgi:hypothetical protein
LVARSYALFGLVPADLDLRSLFLSVYTEQVSGFYDPDSTALFVLDDQPAETLRAVLVHELVHAVQDQAVNLDSLTARERGNDRRAAAQAAIEGHATLVMMEYTLEQFRGAPVDLAAGDDPAMDLRPSLTSLTAQYPALAGAPLVVQEALLFPYMEGASFVRRTWQEAGGRPAPFGALLPESTEQVLDPERLLGPERDDPREIEIRVPGSPILYQDVLGQLEAAVLLAELSGQPRRPGDASGWRGDRYALLDTPSGDALVWAAVWDDVVSRDRYLARLSPLLERLMKSGSVRRVDISGFPGFVLRVGEVGTVDIAMSGPASDSAAPSSPKPATP